MQTTYSATQFQRYSLLHEPRFVQEITKFEKSFKDPKFMELLADYAKDIADPQVNSV